jgi:Cytochrome c
MNKSLLVLVCVVLLAMIIVTAGRRPVSAAASGGDKIARGKYIVTQVSMCTDCHTPHNEKGEPVMEKFLQGAPIEFKPLVPMPWGSYAPPIAGLPSMNEQEGIAFLTTGKRPNGTLCNPPMPQYRLDSQDAAAVVVYLKSLKP